MYFTQYNELISVHYSVFQFTVYNGSHSDSQCSIELVYLFYTGLNFSKYNKIHYGSRFRLRNLTMILE